MPKPSLCVFMIVKNEERDLPRCLESMRKIADTVVIVDTGSTDGTCDKAIDICSEFDTRLDYSWFYDASKEDENGDYKLQDFSAARNESIRIAEATGCTHLMWMDADDELLDPDPILHAMYRDDVDVWSVFIQGGNSGQKWLHHRLWKNGLGIRFHGRVHEWAKVDGFRHDTCFATIRHHADPDASQENSNERNLRLLKLEWEDHPDDKRTAFYLGCTYRDAGKHAEAIEWFQKRLDLGEGYRDEALFAWLYLARAHAATFNFGRAEDLLNMAIRHEPSWAEFPMELANLMYQQKEYETCIQIAKTCVGMEIPITALWREHEAYRDQPLRWISWSYEHLGDIRNAIGYAVNARQYINGYDQDWEMRIERLKGMESVPIDPWPTRTAVMSNFEETAAKFRRKRKVALVRPGAIGDILMTLNLIPLFKEANPDTEITYFCAPQYGGKFALGPIMYQAGVDRVMDCTHIESWRRSFDQVINLVGYPLHEGYPNSQMRQHLLYYFAEEMGLDLRKVGLPQLTLPKPKNPLGLDMPYVTLQKRAGWSHYKEWDDMSWESVYKSSMLENIPRWVFIEEGYRSLYDSMAIIANAALHVGIDSFGNHLTNYLWEDEKGAHKVPGVILWGSTQPSASGYAHNRNIWKGLPCQPCFKENPEVSQQPNGICMIPIVNGNGEERKYGDGWHRCMSLINTYDVIEAVAQAWEEINK